MLISPSFSFLWKHPPGKALLKEQGIGASLVTVLQGPRTL